MKEASKQQQQQAALSKVAASKQHHLADMASSSVPLDKFDIALFTKKEADKKDMKDKTSDGTQFTLPSIQAQTS